MIKWILCPNCGKKLCKVDTEDVVTLYLWCRQCKSEVEIHVEESQNESRRNYKKEE